MKYTKKKYIRKRTKRVRGKSRVTKRHRRYKKKSFLLVGGNDPCNYETDDEVVKNLAMYACGYSKKIDELKKKKFQLGCRNKPLFDCENDHDLKRIIDCPTDLTLSQCEELLVSDYNEVLKDFNNNVNNNNNDDHDVLVNTVFRNYILNNNDILKYYQEAKMTYDDDYDTVKQKHNTLMETLRKDSNQNKEKIEKYESIYKEIKKKLENLQEK